MSEKLTCSNDTLPDQSLPATAKDLQVGHFRNQNRSMPDAVKKPEKQRGRPFRPGVSGNPRGRPRGARNKRTRTLLEAAGAGGEMPLDFLLGLMRDSHSPIARRLEAAKAAGSFLHARLCAVEPKLSTAAADITKPREN
jgi:hypothetical protein